MYQQATRGIFSGMLSKYKCGFRKGYSVINALLPMIEKWRKSLDAGGALGAQLNDLSKAFDYLPHELLITKFHAYRVDFPSLKPLHSYLTKRKQRVKLNGTYSSWSEILRPYLDHCYSRYFYVTYSNFFIM